MASKSILNTFVLHAEMSMSLQISLLKIQEQAFIKVILLFLPTCWQYLLTEHFPAACKVLLTSSKLHIISAQAFAFSSQDTALAQVQEAEKIWFALVRS